MSVAPHAGIVDFGTFTPPNATKDGIQGEVPQPLAGQQDYVLTANGFVPSGSIPGLGTMATQNANAVAITGGTIDNTVIGATTPAAGTFTTITGQTEVLKGTGSNLLLQSSSLTTSSAWGAVTNVTLTGGQSDPFGGTTACLFNNGTNAGNHSLGQGFTSYAQIYTSSIYAKAGTANYVGLYSNNGTKGAFFNLTTGAFSSNIVSAPISYTSTNAGNGWWRFSITYLTTAGSDALYIFISEDGVNYSYTGTSKTITVAAPQLEVGTTANTYIPTTTTAIYGTPTLSFSGVAGLGLQSDGSLYVSPAGTGALQAQATTSSTVGGNARGANAVDWQTSRGSAGQIAGSQYAVLSGGASNTSGGYGATVAGGLANNNVAAYGFIGGGYNNSQNSNYLGTYAVIGGGSTNSANGYFNFIGGGFTNSGTSVSAVTTQSATMNGTTAVTLSGSNANIKVGQYITGTSIAGDTYVAAISGTALTLSKNASGSSTATLSFYTPHGVVVGGGNNQATGSYSFIGGGGDAGTAANRNVASGDYSFVGGGRGNVASVIGAVCVGGGSAGDSTNRGNTASGAWSFIGGGLQSTASGVGSVIVGGNSNAANGNYSSAFGANASTRGIFGNFTMSSGALTALGDNQTSILVLKKQTTDATATVITSDGGVASTTNQVILPNNSAYFFRGEVVSGVTGGGNTKGWTIEGVIKRGANAASTALVGTPTVVSAFADAGAATWTIAVTADTTNGGLAVTFTGQVATTIRVVAQLRTTEMTY